jgi:REP element-mobilizing transposase RayT
MKESIKSAICNFSKGTITDNSLEFFKVLGYDTSLTITQNEKTYKSFKENFVDNSPNKDRFNEVKVFSNNWKSIDFLFQLADNLSGIKGGKVDNQIINSVVFACIELSGSTYSRTQLAEITRQVNLVFAMPVVLLFKYNDSISLSVIHRRVNKKDEQKDVLEKVTLIKDISIAFPHRAQIDILYDFAFSNLSNKKNPINYVELTNAWEQVFNTKKLNDDFYKELFKWYLFAKNNVSFPNDYNEENDKFVSETLIRFISRMLFVWFMKEKKLINQTIFDKDELKNILKDFDETTTKNIYYKAILQNLFFATLNVPIDNRKWIDGKKRNKAQIGDPLIYRYEKEFKNSEDVIENIFMKIPFLNGGLFDCLDDRENNIFTDGFTKNEKKQPQFPNYLFFGEHKNIDLSHHFADDAKEKKKWQNQHIFGIIDLLNNYKFTIEENTPLEIDVALDPELLGKVFENLLASFNPETKATARKQTGSFYTPREIVNYMVDESLKAYCTSNLQLDPKCTSSFQLENKNKIGIGSSEFTDFLDPNNEIIIHKKKLPHWFQEDVWYFVTFRLADSIPEEKKEEIRKERENWEKQNKNKKEFTKQDWITYNKLFHENTEKLLNSGFGKCLMNKKENADIVANALLHFNNERYILDEWVVMPNHVHVLVKPIGEHYLGDILHSWKSFTANEINKNEGLSGQLWMTESYDHIVRNKESLNAIRNYIRENPSKAKITVLRASSLKQTVLRASSSEQLFEQDARNTVSELFSITSHEEMSDSLRARSSEYVQALFKCKILDPACGSGAYPMGVLHKMVELMTILDPKNEHLKQIEGKKLDDLIKSAQKLSDTNTRNQTIEALQKQKEILQNAAYDYVRKLYIIENCIYGVDIQPIAIQISKLRFFISLLVEQNKKEDQPILA